jgi:hypothetical protein
MDRDVQFLLLLISMLVLIIGGAIVLTVREEGAAREWCKAKGYTRTTHVYKTGTYCVDRDGHLVVPDTL